MWAYNSIFIRFIQSDSVGHRCTMTACVFLASAKLMDWSEYLQTLGVDSILLNPIFESDNHGYDTRDFKEDRLQTRYK